MSDTKPSNPYLHPVESGGVTHPGATLRDWFAGQIMAGMHSNAGLNPHKTADELAAIAYERADALLKAREET